MTTTMTVKVKPRLTQVEYEVGTATPEGRWVKNPSGAVALFDVDLLLLPGDVLWFVGGKLESPLGWRVPVDYERVSLAANVPTTFMFGMGG